MQTIERINVAIDFVLEYILLYMTGFVENAFDFENESILPMDQSVSHNGIPVKINCIMFF